MKLREYLSLKRGRAAWLARSMSISTATIADWAADKKYPSPKNCIVIEKLLDGNVTRRELRQNDWWEIWPEFAGLQAASISNPPPSHNGKNASALPESTQEAA
jgi:DNA-binding transcriptional regulator YdaS (Cro superfamily)